MKVNLTLSIDEIKEAIEEYANDRIRPGYRYDFSDFDITVEESGETPVLSCEIYATIIPQEEK